MDVSGGLSRRDVNKNYGTLRMWSGPFFSGPGYGVKSPVINNVISSHRVTLLGSEERLVVDQT